MLIGCYNFVYQQINRDEILNLLSYSEIYSLLNKIKAFIFQQTFHKLWKAENNKSNLLFDRFNHGYNFLAGLTMLAI